MTVYSDVRYADALGRIEMTVTLEPGDAERLCLLAADGDVLPYSYSPTDGSLLSMEIAAYLDAEAPQIAAYVGPTDAERAANIVLRRAAFLMAVDAALDLGNQPGAPDPVDHIVAVIQASGGALGPAERSAILLVRYAGEFHRDDPEAPGLMDAVGGALGLTPGQIDALFLSAAGG